MANEYFDIAIDSTGKMLIQNGDWAIQPAPAVDAQLLLLSTPGAFTQSPVLFVNLYSYLNTPFTVTRRNQLLARIRTVLDTDGLIPIKLDITAVDKINLKVRRN